MRDAENIRAVIALEPDFIGHIFYAGSPRFIADADFTMIKKASPNVKRVGVFVNENLKNILKQITDFDLYAVQLHGQESPELCRQLNEKTIVIKAFGVDESFDFNLLKVYEKSVDFFLFDTKTSAHGGSGKVFDWQVLQNYTGKIPFFLSGGIGPDNMQEAIKLNHPAFFGVDLNSKFETSPGIKDVEKLEKAFRAIRGKIGNRE